MRRHQHVFFENPNILNPDILNYSLRNQSGR